MRRLFFRPDEWTLAKIAKIAKAAKVGGLP
jgi:hypothetical protein